jgi:hypothetical protein
MRSDPVAEGQSFVTIHKFLLDRFKSFSTFGTRQMKISFGSCLLFAAAVGGTAGEAQRVRSVNAPIVRLVARDFMFETPPRLPAGVVRIRLVNRGSEPHYASFYRLAAGRTATDFFAWRASRTPSPEWLTLASGPAPVAPGDSSDLTLRLPSGHYLIICGYPGKDGLQHLDKGMFRVLDAQPLLADGRGEARFPGVARTLRLADSGFSLDQPIPSGWRAIGIENRGSTAEQALIVRLPGGVDLADEQRWFDDGFRSARPGIPSGGALVVSPGERYVITRYFAPGRYALLSHLTGRWRTLLFVVGR